MLVGKRYVHEGQVGGQVGGDEEKGVGRRKALVGERKVR